MDKGTAERWVTISAMLVIGIYGYRRITETAESGSLKNIIGLGNPVPFSQFITAWGFVYFMLALATEAAPGLGGGMAILIAVSDFLTNAPAFLGDVTKQEGLSSTKLTAASTNSPQATATRAASSIDPGFNNTPGFAPLTTTAPTGLKP